ncbi:MAG: glycosyltransferase family 2 protein [Candidatus Omnitrophica bacterium]|nr:glycosyltransferase family 2 protein [Candidatus Omnitrophota bacterium]
MSKYDLVSIIVPAFNEVETVEELYLRTKKTLDAQRQIFEFIFIDDGSTDGTFDKIKKLWGLYPNIIALRHFRNHGKSVALMQGFDAAKGDVAITMDADLQDNPEVIPQFLAKLEEGYDFVNGWRQRRNDFFTKRLLSRLFNSLVSHIFKCDLHDINCGFKAYRRQVYKILELRGDLHRMVPVLVCSRGFKITEISVVHSKRKHGKSKYKLIRYRGILDIISIVATNATELRPFHVFFEMSFFLWLLAMISFTVRAGLIAFSLLSPALRNFLSAILFFSAAWFIFLGTILPIFGLSMEIMLSQSQRANWRRKLIKDKLHEKA